MKHLAKLALAGLAMAAITAAFAVTARAQENSDGGQRLYTREAAAKQDVEGYFRKDGKHRAEVKLYDGSKIVGKVTEIHETDFVMIDNRTHSRRTIAYADVKSGPERKWPLGAVIAEDTGFGVLFVACLPLFFPCYLLMMAGVIPD